MVMRNFFFTNFMLLFLVLQLSQLVFLQDACCMQEEDCQKCFLNENGLDDEQLKLYKLYQEVIKTKPAFVIYEFSCKFFSNFLKCEENKPVIFLLKSILHSDITLEEKFLGILMFFQEYDKVMKSDCFDYYFGFVGVEIFNPIDLELRYWQKKKEQVFNEQKNQDKSEEVSRKESNCSNASQGTNDTLNENDFHNNDIQKIQKSSLANRRLNFKIPTLTIITQN
jgi:hypothetical protein